MIKRKFKTAFYVFSTVAVALSFIAPSVAQSRQYGQQTSPLVDLIGTIAKASAKSNAKKKWAKVSPEIQQCVNTYLASRDITVNQMITEGLSPNHEKVMPFITMCQSVMAAQLKANFPCNTTNSKGLQVATTCVQSYAKAVNGKWVPISRDDFLRAAANNVAVNIADFETQVAQNARLAEEKRLAQEAAAKAEAARVERLAREETARKEQQARAEEERLRFAASPEGKRQAAERAVVLRKAEEARRTAEIRKASEFPYYAVITCGVGYRFIPIAPCLSDVVDTTIEVRNGREYGNYNITRASNNQIPNSRQTTEGFFIDLRPSFSVKMQNASSNLILGMKVYRRQSNSVIYSKEVQRFSVVSFGM